MCQRDSDRLEGLNKFLGMLESLCPLLPGSMLFFVSGYGLVTCFARRYLGNVIKVTTLPKH